MVSTHVNDNKYQYRPAERYNREQQRRYIISMVSSLLYRVIVRGGCARYEGTYRDFALPHLTSYRPRLCCVCIFFGVNVTCTSVELLCL